MIRKAVYPDVDAVAGIYDALHGLEESGAVTVGWIRGVYPTRATALDALQRGDLFVFEDGGAVLAAAVINRIQMDAYRGAPWKYPADDSRVCVLHTLVVSPSAFGRGIGTRFVRFYESYAAGHQWPELRMDTNARNLRARAMYRGLGYTETAVVPTVFNGIPGVDLVLLEKNLAAPAGPDEQSGAGGPL